ncbi:MAG TPA: DUF305 domain-containing protein [Alphaproteobacteria bacterium]|nr:DUF305 domain-containing protein [Alphaproteobacteria bacterium]
MIKMNLFVIMIIAILISGCASHVSHTVMEVHSEETFITDMIPHHQEAVDASKIILSTENEELKELANNIIAAQEQEIEMMNNWLDEWYPQSSYKAMYHPMMPDLSSLSGEERDKAYLEGMIAHHQMAVQMAQDVLKLNPRPEVKELAENIITTQNAEIDQMRQMLKEY